MHAAPAVEPPWMKIARDELGVSEYTPQRPGPHGELSNPRVEEYQRAANGREDDEVPWCSSFLCWVMQQSGYRDTNSGAARSWMRESVTTAVIKPEIGTIVVLWREKKTGYKGHVGFFVREDKQGMWLLSGNAGNAVTIKPFPRSRLLGFRQPILLAS